MVTVVLKWAMKKMVIIGRLQGVHEKKVIIVHISVIAFK